MASALESKSISEIILVDDNSTDNTCKILNNIKDIGFIKFDEKDVVRNPLVSKIVSKYDEFEKSEGVGKEYLSKEKND